MLRLFRVGDNRAAAFEPKPAIDRAWWMAMKATLEHRFSQDEVIIRAHEVEVL